MANIEDNQTQQTCQKEPFTSETESNTEAISSEGFSYEAQKSIMKASDCIYDKIGLLEKQKSRWPQATMALGATMALSTLGAFYAFTFLSFLTFVPGICLGMAVSILGYMEWQKKQYRQKQSKNLKAYQTVIIRNDTYNKIKTGQAHLISEEVIREFTLGSQSIIGALSNEEVQEAFSYALSDNEEDELINKVKMRAGIDINHINAHVQYERRLQQMRNYLTHQASRIQEKMIGKKHLEKLNRFIKGDALCKGLFTRDEKILLRSAFQSMIDEHFIFVSSSSVKKEKQMNLLSCFIEDSVSLIEGVYSRDDEKQISENFHDIISKKSSIKKVEMTRPYIKAVLKNES